MDNTAPPINLQTLIATLLQGVQAQNLIATKIGSVFPVATGTAGTATGGAATLPTNPVGFIEVFVPSLNATVLLPYYTA